jgi:hypothetical protein
MYSKVKSGRLISSDDRFCFMHIVAFYHLLNNKTIHCFNKYNHQPLTLI